MIHTRASSTDSVCLRLILHNITDDDDDDDGDGDDGDGDEDEDDAINDECRIVGGLSFLLYRDFAF